MTREEFLNTKNAFNVPGMTDEEILVEAREYGKKPEEMVFICPVCHNLRVLNICPMCGNEEFFMQSAERLIYRRKMLYKPDYICEVDELSGDYEFPPEILELPYEDDDIPGNPDALIMEYVKVYKEYPIDIAIEYVIEDLEYDYGHSDYWKSQVEELKKNPIVLKRFFRNQDKQKIRGITIAFENVEVTEQLSVGKDLDVDYVKIDGISNSIRSDDGFLSESKCCDEFELILNPSTNCKKTNYSNYDNPPKTLFERFTECQDIIALNIEYENGSTDRIWVPWSDDEYNNKYQISEIASDGKLHITIKRPLFG